MSTRGRRTRTVVLLVLSAAQPVAAHAALPPPSAADPVTAAATPCAGQGLSISVPATISFPPAPAGAGDQTVSAPADFTVNDQTGSNAAWRIAATSTQFADAAGDVLPTDTTTVAAAGASPAPGPCAIAPANRVAYPTTLPAGLTPPVAAWLYGPLAGTGTGDSTVNLTFDVVIPASAKAGPFASVWTFTVASGP